MPRIPLPGRPAARYQAARLLDLSLTGMRLEHLNHLRPGAACTVELPSALGGLVLAAQVVWSRVIGTESSPEGQPLLRYQSGLMFPSQLRADGAGVLRAGLRSRHLAALRCETEQPRHLAHGLAGVEAVGAKTGPRGMGNGPTKLVGQV